MSIFKGAGVAIITPFTATGEVDYPAFARIIEAQILGRTDAIIVCGTTGEASTLSHEEHIECIRFCVKQVNGRLPVIAGTGSNSTETAIYLSQEAEKAGADAVLLVSPYYNKATQNGLYAHFRAVAESIKLPVILYNIPGRTGVLIQASTILRLANDVENIVAVKEATGDISFAATLMSKLPENFDVYSGNDDQIVPLLSLGASGVISVLSNVVPGYTHGICQSYFGGDVKKSAKLQLRAIPLINALFSEVNPIPVKAAMNMLGYCENVLRMPLTQMEEAHAEVLRAELSKLGML